MLKVSLPHSMCLSVTDKIPSTPLDKNAVYRYLEDLDQRLRAAKESMEPHFKKYDRQNGRNIFKTITSNFESFKFTRTTIAQNRNTPSVSNAWIKAYELISEFNLIPDIKNVVKKQWNHFDNCSFPGSFILAVYHYIYTKRESEFHEIYNWFASSLLSDVTQDEEHPDAVLGDQYELYKRYSKDSEDGTNHWLMDPEAGLIGDILDIKYIRHIESMLGNDFVPREAEKGEIDMGGQVDLYTSEFGIDVSEKKMYNEQEFVHAKGDLAQALCGLKVLRKNGHMICKIFTFFNPFTLSLISLLSECFEEFYICKPASSKPDNSEIFLVGKRFNIEKGYEASYIMEKFLANPNSDYRLDTLVNIERLNQKFWDYIKKAAYDIFDKLQIGRIQSNIEVFDKLVSKYGDPNESRDIEEKIKRESHNEYHSRIVDDNEQWFNTNSVLVLRKEYRLNIIDITERKASKPRQYDNRSQLNNRSHNNGSQNNYRQYTNRYDRQPSDNKQYVNKKSQSRTSFSFSAFGQQ